MSESAHPGSWQVGTSGWIYPHWRGVFYPTELPQARWFAYYAQHFDTVEINNTFYRLPQEHTFDQWREQAPERFLYAIKVSRYITHLRKLRDCAEPEALFLERARRLGSSLGPLLYQLPPHWRPNLPRLEEFAHLLPRDLLHVFEFRDTGWFLPETYALLRAYGLAFCIYHMGETQSPLEVTAHAIYLRFHGTGIRYGGDYPLAVLREWAERIRTWCGAGHTVYVYFNNDIGGYAVRNALTLKALLSEDPGYTGQGLCQDKYSMLQS